MEKISVRHATREDLKLLLRFEQELILAERPMDPTIRQEPVSYYDMEDLIQNPEVGLMVAEVGGRVVGSGYARAKKARPYLDHEYYAYLGFMYTLPEFRGKGVNREIMDALGEWARQRGLKELRLTVYDTNIPAIRAYEKAGFVKHIIEMRLNTESE